MISLEAKSGGDVRTGVALGLLGPLFTRLHAERIGYCHWKSNEHLQASMAGLTDLDVLIDRRSAARLPLVLEELGFRRFQARPGRGYPGIEDYVGFDVESGRLSHLHVHHQLTVGARYLKGHRLPWEDVVLGNRRFDHDCGVFVAGPEIEMLILAARAALKVRWRDHIGIALGRSDLRGGVQREFAWLAERVDLNRLEALANQLVGKAAARTLRSTAERGVLSTSGLRAFRRQCHPNLDTYRMYGPVAAVVRQWTRELRSVGDRARRKIVGGVLGAARTAPYGGRVVAIIGADGAGKSTLTRELASWLSRQTWVVTAYGGSGAGSASTLRRLLELSARLTRHVTRSRRRVALEQTDADPGRDGGQLSTDAGALSPRSLWRALWVMSLARERRRRLEKAWRARNLGAVVIADRHPQTQFSGLSDGPHLESWRSSRSTVLRFAAERERRAFEAMDRYAPDVVVKLLVTAEVALQRKPARSESQLRRKVEIIGKLKFPLSTRVVEVDAELPLQQVLLAVKRAIWESL